MLTPKWLEGSIKFRVGHLIFHIQLRCYMIKVRWLATGNEILTAKSQGKDDQEKLHHVISEGILGGLF